MGQSIHVLPPTDPTDPSRSEGGSQVILSDSFTTNYIISTMLVFVYFLVYIICIHVTQSVFLPWLYECIHRFEEAYELDVSM